jgi:hypothetical protein
MTYRPLVMNRPFFQTGGFRPPPPSVNYRININNNVWYAPRYYSTCARPGWGGSFWTGFGTGMAANYLAAEYGRWNGFYPGAYYYPPSNYWSPYYRSVLAAPLWPPPVYYPPAAYAPAAPPPVQLSQQDQQLLANLISQHAIATEHGWIQRPHEISDMNEIFARLSRGEGVDVGGRIVKDGPALMAALADVRNREAAEASNDNASQGGLPSFAQVFGPRAVLVEGAVGNDRVNRTLDAAARIYLRPDVQQQIAQAMQATPAPDRNTLNQQILGIVTNALIADLRANRENYAKNPASAPIPFLTEDRRVNERIIDEMMATAPVQLQQNLIAAQNLKPPAQAPAQPPPPPTS